MEEKPNAEEEFWDWKETREQLTDVELKNKEDEFNGNSTKEEINSNNHEQLKQQSHEPLKTYEKKNRADKNMSVDIEQLIKSLDKLKPTHYDRNTVPDSDKSNAADYQHNALQRNENHISSDGDNRSQTGDADTAADTEGSGNDRETHGEFSKDKKTKYDLILKDGKAKDHNSEINAAEYSHHKGNIDDVTAKEITENTRKETGEAESLSECNTFIDYGLPSEGSQSKRSSHVTSDDNLMVIEDSQGKTLKVHPPKSGAAHQTRSKPRNVVAKTSKHSAKANDLDMLQREKDKEAEENNSEKLLQDAESSGKENNSMPKATQKQRARSRRRVKPLRSSSPANLERDGAREEEESSRSPPRMRKELRSGDYDWLLSGNEEIREWVKKKNRIARKQKAENRKKEKFKKLEAEGKLVGLDGNLEKKPAESLKRKKKPKAKQRSNSYPGDVTAGDREDLPRSRSLPRMSKEQRSGHFDWSASKNEEIRMWLKKKNRIFRRQRAEERKKEKMKKKEEEQKRREHEEMYADSFARVSEWMKQKRREEYMLRQKEKAGRIKAEQEKEMLMILGRKMKYEPVLTGKQANVPEKEQESTSINIQKQEQILKEPLRDEPLLKQREKQRQLMLRTGPKEPINLNKTLNLSHLSKENERAEQKSARVANLPSSPDKRIKLIKPSVRTQTEPLLPRQSFSLPKAPIPPGSGRVSKEPANVKQRMSFDEWLRRKNVEDEKKRLTEQAKISDGLGKEPSNSAEVTKIKPSPERKPAPTGSTENLSKKATRLKSALKKERQPQLPLERGLATSQEQESSWNKPNPVDEASVEDVSNVSQLPVESSEPSARPSRPLYRKGTRSGQPEKMAASEEVTDKVPNPYVMGGSDIPATVLRAKSPKPKVAVRPTLRSVKYQQGSWEGFSNYLWDQVNEAEGGEITTSHDKLRMEPTGAEADRIETSFEEKAEKLEDNAGHGEKVEASAETHEGSLPQETTLEMKSSRNIESELPRMPCQAKEVDDNFRESDTRNCTEDVVPCLTNEEGETQMKNLTDREYNSIPSVNEESRLGMSSGRRHNIRTIIDAEDEETDTELEAEAKAELKLDRKAESRRENKTDSEMEELEKKHGNEKAKETGIALTQHASSGNLVNLSDSENEIASDMDFPKSDYSSAD